MTREPHDEGQLESLLNPSSPAIDGRPTKAIQDAISELVAWTCRSADKKSPDDFLRQHGDLSQVSLRNVSEVRELQAAASLVKLVDQTLHKSPLVIDSYSETRFVSVAFISALHELYLGALRQTESEFLPLQARTLGRLLLQRHAKIARISEKEPSTPYLEQLSWRNYVASIEEALLGANYWIPSPRDWKYRFTRYDVRSHEPFPYREIVELVVSYGVNLAESRRHFLREEENRLSASRASLSKWQDLHRYPGAQPYGVSHRGAEEWIRDWCLHMGMEGALVTAITGDGGIDIESPFHIVQVKNYQGTVPIREIREFLGVAATDGRRPHFFTSGSYTASADLLASNASLSLFRYDILLGQVTAENSIAARILNGRGFLTI